MQSTPAQTTSNSSSTDSTVAPSSDPLPSSSQPPAPSFLERSLCRLADFCYFLFCPLVVLSILIYAISRVSDPGVYDMASSIAMLACLLWGAGNLLEHWENYFIDRRWSLVLDEGRPS